MHYSVLKFSSQSYDFLWLDIYGLPKTCWYFYGHKIWHLLHTWIFYFILIRIADQQLHSMTYGPYAEWFVSYQLLDFISILALVTGISVHLISTKRTGECQRSSEDAYFSMTHDPFFALLGSVLRYASLHICCFWIVITCMFNTLLASPIDIHV
jgi:hypothetical protein